MLKIKTGIDILRISEFDRMVKTTADLLKHRVFLEEELANASHETLAGIFCAKEAVIKALSLTVDDWKNIRILKRVDGKPYVKVKAIEGIESDDLSISHEEDIVVAVYVCLLNI